MAQLFCFLEGSNSLCNRPDVLAIAVINDTALGGLLQSNLVSLSSWLTVALTSCSWVFTCQREIIDGTSDVEEVRMSVHECVCMCLWKP
jgi:hypothetical protein